MNKQTATFLGGNLNLTYAGKHAYAFSEAAAANTTPVTALKFTTGAHYIKGIFSLSTGLEDGGVSSAAAYSNIKLNGLGVANLWAGFGAGDAVSLSQLHIILPPFTEVSANLFGDESAASRFMFISFSGRVYDLDE